MRLIFLALIVVVTILVNLGFGVYRDGKFLRKRADTVKKQTEELKGKTDLLKQIEDMQGCNLNSRLPFLKDRGDYLQYMYEQNCSLTTSYLSFTNDVRLLAAFSNAGVEIFSPGLKEKAPVETVYKDSRFSGVKSMDITLTFSADPGHGGALSSVLDGIFGLQYIYPVEINRVSGSKGLISVELVMYGLQ